jgi:hypothetical protein
MEMVAPQPRPFIEMVRFEVELPRGKLEAVRTETQRLHIELGNSESKKEFFRQKVQERRSQVETERASRERIGAELSPATEKFCLCHHSLRKISTRRGNHYQPARPPSAKNPRCHLQTLRQFWRL